MVWVMGRLWPISIKSYVYLVSNRIRFGLLAAPAARNRSARWGLAHLVVRGRGWEGRRRTAWAPNRLRPHSPYSRQTNTYKQNWYHSWLLANNINHVYNTNGYSSSPSFIHHSDTGQVCFHGCLLWLQLCRWLVAALHWTPSIHRVMAQIRENKQPEPVPAHTSPHYYY